MQPTVLVPQSAQPAQPAAPLGTTRFVYDGRLSELYIIFLKNVLLTIVTFGIYRFWGKTNIRRYLWSRTSLLGDRFEYTGTGKELFLGFLVVLVFFAIIGGLFFLINLLSKSSPAVSFVLLILLYIFFGYFFFLGQFTALRYRLTRTHWRGIRGAMGGSPWRFGWLALWWAFCSICTFGLLAPLAVFRTLRYRLDNSYFGTARARFDGKASDIYGRFVGYYVGSIVVGLVAIVAVFAIIASTGFLDQWIDLIGRAVRQEKFYADEGTLQRMQIALMVSVYIAAFFVALAVLPLLCWYTAYLFNYLMAHTEIAGARFAGHLKTWRIFNYVIVNVLIMLFTLGFGFPWVLHRIMNFLTANVEFASAPNVDAVLQNQMPMPKRGEGLLALLDPGII